jgi:hypothetical protein
MFIRVVERQLKYDTALDFKLLESYRPAPDQPPKHRFIRQWTIRQVDLKLWGKDSFLDDVERDLEYTDLPKSEQQKALSAVKKALCRYRKGGF